MRFLTSVVVAGCLLTSNLAAAQCAKVAEKNAFDVTGLKSQLMVTAISCHAQDKYNAFVMRFRDDLVAQERTLNAYFTRTFGRRATQEHDDYITSLANTVSQNGLKRGTLFCDENVGIFDEVLLLKTGRELPTYAASKSLVQPITLVTCADPTPTKTRTAQAGKK